MPVSTRRHALRSLAGLVVAVVASCGAPSTSVTQVWQASLTPSPMRSMIVFAARMDEANRRALEDALVAELAQHDVAARPSYTIFPGEPPDREKARESVKGAGFEGILVATMKSVRERQTYVAGTYSGGFWSTYYGPGWGSYSPGYVDIDEVVSFETTLWDTRAEDKLVWAMFSETTNPSAGRSFVKSLTKSIIEGLEKSRPIPLRRSD